MPDKRAPDHIWKKPIIRGLPNNKMLEKRAPDRSWKKPIKSGLPNNIVPDKRAPDRNWKKPIKVGKSLAAVGPEGVYVMRFVAEKICEFVPCITQYDEMFT